MLAVLVLDAAVQKGRFHMQWLKAAQQRKPEGGIPQKTVRDAEIGNLPCEPECLVPALSLQGNIH